MNYKYAGVIISGLLSALGGIWLVSSQNNYSDGMIDFFGNDGTQRDRVLEETVAGGVTINDTILHIAQENLPFGGVGPSGMGHYHGSEGFKTFSKQKAVFYQSRLNGMSLFNPPYGALFERLAKFLMR